MSAISAAVPKNCVVNRSYTEFFSASEAELITDKTGIEERRFAPKGMTASDLCYHAAEEIFNKEPAWKEQIDALIFVSQTADYRMPASSIILQDRLNLPKKTIAFDINIGCSGYVYGLSVAMLYASQPHIRKVLLLDGETRSRVYSPKDRKTAFLFGDGGTASIIEKQTQSNDITYLFGSDGSRSDLIKMDAGGYRYPSSIATLTEKVVDEYGNIRSDEHGYMNGADVFAFVLREIPFNIKEILSLSNTTQDSIDSFYFHQANKYMNDYLLKKLKVSADIAPQSLHKYGNTSSVSIPLTIVDANSGKEIVNKKWFLSGFGVGMSWGSCVLPISNLKVHKLIEV